MPTPETSLEGRISWLAHAECAWGAIGGYLGVRLSLASEEITFVAREPNLAAHSGQWYRA